MKSKRFKKITLFSLIMIVAIFPFIATQTGCEGKEHAHETGKGKALYQCSMHPHITSDKPENCPICGMRLTKVDQPSGGGSKPAKGRGKILYYQHPMNPSVTSPVPSKDEMGMDYTPVYEGDAAGSGTITIPGHGEVTITPERQQLIGIETALVKKMPLAVTIRAVGRVAYDPELYNFLSEYKQALSNQEKVKESQLPEIQERSAALVRSSEIKLRQLGLSDAQMKELLKGDQENSNLLLPTETAWVYGEIYEYEMKLVRPGQMAQITTQALPGMTFEGKVIAIDPIVNAMSRTLKVRIEVENKDKSLTPEMYVDVVIEVPLGEKMAIPEDALFDMGDKQFVFVVKDEGRFVPTEIKVGHEADGHYEVLKGLMEGEKVITSSNFLIDSESRFRAAAQGAGGTKKLEDKKAASNEAAPMDGSHAH